MKTLSDKREDCFCETSCGFKKYREEDVKEFIRKLKDKIERTRPTDKSFETDEWFKDRIVTIDCFLNDIDELAGDRLI